MLPNFNINTPTEENMRKRLSIKNTAKPYYTDNSIKEKRCCK